MVVYVGKHPSFSPLPFPDLNSPLRVSTNFSISFSGSVYLSPCLLIPVFLLSSLLSFLILIFPLRRNLKSHLVEESQHSYFYSFDPTPRWLSYIQYKPGLPSLTRYGPSTFWVLLCFPLRPPLWTLSLSSELPIAKRETVRRKDGCGVWITDFYFIINKNTEHGRPPLSRVFLSQKSEEDRGSFP